MGKRFIRAKKGLDVKLHWSPRSPFVRKVVICAIELGIDHQIDRVRNVAMMTKSNPEIMRDNPLSKIPTMVTDEGLALVDSLVICEYLQYLAGGEKIIPYDSEQRISVLNDHALTTNWTELLTLWRNERNKPVERQTPELLTAYAERSNCTLDRLEQEAVAFDANQFDLAKISLGVALAYFNFRFSDIEWSKGRPKLTNWFREFEARPSVRQTVIDPNG